eukprot:Cvel_6265.t1-p1 / transcript=Cvel_6265.t1 / gene=Cvel_6265 / organism=Chromera_velia_CCMP2878 / gene_product=Zinc finger protein 345, putative / transcript_product=Zinc finger protein 345, putative / location=Cvel_scaffold303:90494-92137(-) / protein_length=548 / sequence_SO=supercontig / SO=protein_coding / is_pseudo=false
MCEDCDARFANQSALESHQRGAGHGPFVIVCEDCERQFGSESALERHQRDVRHGPHAFVCEDCERGFGSSSALEQHQQAARHGPHAIVCEDCERAFSSESALEQHQRALRHGPHSLSIVCEDCDRAFGSEEALEAHQQALRHGPHAIVCEECGREFGSASALSQHERDAHQREVHPRNAHYVCEECQRIFETWSALENHQRATAVVCLDCSREFRSTRALEQHQRDVHSGRQSTFTHSRTRERERQTRPHICEECDRVFGSESALAQHQRDARHGGTRIPLVYRDLVEMIRESIEQALAGGEGMSVSSDSDHDCPECGERFETSEKLAEHQTVASTLYVHYDVSAWTTEELRSACSIFGSIRLFFILPSALPNENARGRGHALVEFQSEKSAEHAFLSLNGAVKGRLRGERPLAVSVGVLAGDPAVASAQQPVSTRASSSAPSSSSSSSSSSNPSPERDDRRSRAEMASAGSRENGGLSESECPICMECVKGKGVGGDPGQRWWVAGHCRLARDHKVCNECADKMRIASRNRIEAPLCPFCRECFFMK